MLTWNMFFKMYTDFKFQTYHLAVMFITILTMYSYQDNFDHKLKCLTWCCSDHENCP